MSPEEHALKAAKAVVEEFNAQASLLEEEARALRKRAIEIRANFVAGQFWNIQNIIGKENVEALCEEHPSDLVAYWEDGE